MRVPHIKVTPRVRVLRRFSRAIGPWCRLRIRGRAPFVMARGEGAVVEDVDGNIYLDCCAGIAVNATGYSHPDVVRAISDQASRFLHISTDYYHEPQVALGEVISSLAPVGQRARTFFSNSGTEAVEAAIKLARHHTRRAQHHRVSRIVSWAHAGFALVDREPDNTAEPASVRWRRACITRRIPIPIARLAGRDGDSCAEASLSFIENEIFAHLVSRPMRLRPSSSSRFREKEVISFRLRSSFRASPDIASRHGMLLVADEVQSGIGRTGKMFAVEHFGVRARHRRRREGNRVRTSHGADDCA